MATQELKTQLVFEAFDAIKNAEALRDTLMKISQVDFKQLSANFREMAKAVENTQKQVTDSVSKVVEKAKKETAKAQEKAQKEAAKAQEKAQKEAAKAQEKAQKEAVKAQEKAQKEASKKEETARKQAQKARDAAQRDAEKYQRKTLELREQESKALENLSKKIFKESDFNAVEKRILGVAQALDKINKSANVTASVNSFINFLKGINEGNYQRLKKEAEERIPTLFERHRGLVQDIINKYSADPKANIKAEQDALVELSREVSRLCTELGKAGVAAAYFKQAFNLTQGRAEFAELNREIQAFRQKQKITDADWAKLGETSYLETRRRLLKEIETGTKGKTLSPEGLAKLQSELATVNADLARFYELTGRAKDGLKYLNEAATLSKDAPEMFKRYTDEVNRLNEALGKNTAKKTEAPKDSAVAAIKTQVAQQFELLKQQRLDAEYEARALKLMRQAQDKQLAVEGRFEQKNKNTYTDNELKKITGQFEKWGAELDRIAPHFNASKSFDAFLTKIRETNAALVEQKKALEEAAKAKKDYDDKIKEAQGRQLIQEHKTLMSKIAGDFTAGKLDNIVQDRQQLSDLTRQIAQLYITLGKAGTAASYFKQALSTISDPKAFGTLFEEIKEFQALKKLNDRSWNRLAIDDDIKKFRLYQEELKRGLSDGTWSKDKIAQVKIEMSELASKIATVAMELGQAQKGAQLLAEALKLPDLPQNHLKRLSQEYRDLQTLALGDQQRLKNLTEQAKKDLGLVNDNKKSKSNENADRKADEEKIARLERIARLSGRIAEIQSRINARFAAGKPFSENEFIKIRNQLHNIGLEMDKITGKNVSGYLSYILDSVKVKNTPNTDATVKRLSDRYDEARKRAEDAATQFAKTKSIADAIRLKGAMSDLQTITKETETVNRLLGKTQGAFERLTELLSRRIQWHLGEDLVRQLIDMPAVFLQHYRDIEQAMAGVQQVMPLVEGKPAEIFAETSRLFDVAEGYARTMQGVVEGATLWGRGYGKPVNDVDEIRQSLEETNQALIEQGLSVDAVTDSTVNYINEAEAMATTNELVRQSAMLATVDNFSMAESVKGLEAVLAAYGLRAKTAAEATLYAGRAVDIITKVAHYGQISAQDLVRGIEATGKAAEQAGISLEFLTAMLETGVRNTAKSGSDIGNAIKALTVGLYSEKGQSKLNEFGIQTTFVDEKGLQHARSAQAIILDIARALNEGNKNAQKMLLAISGGRYQYSKISAILKDETEILRMWSEAINSAGFADRQLEVQMNTINAKMKQFEASVQELGNTVLKGGIGNLIKEGIEKITAAIKSLETNLNAAAAAGKTFVGIFAISKVLSFGAAIVSVIKKIVEFKKQLTATGYTGGLMGVLKRGIAGILDPAMNGRRQLIPVNQALTATENQLTAAQRQQIATQSQALLQSFQIMGIRMRQIGVNNMFLAALRAKTAGIVADTAALGANAMASRAATGAMLPLAGAMTVATGGFTLLTTLLTVGVPLLIGWANTTDTAAEKIDKLTDKTEKFIGEKEEESNALAQDIMRRRQNVEIMETAINQYMSATKALKSAEEGSEDYAKAVERQKTAEKILAQALSDEVGELNTAAVARIKAADDTRAAFEKEKEAYINGTKEKRKELEKARQAEKDALDERLQAVTKMKNAYDDDIKNFGKWKIAQSEGLESLKSLWDDFWAHAYRGTLQIEKMRDLEAKKYGNMYGFPTQNYLEYQKKRTKEKAEEERAPLKQQLEKEEKELKARKAALAATDFEETPFKTDIEGETIVEATSESSKKKKKYVEQYDTVVMRYLGAVAKQSKKLSVADLVAMGGFVKGGNGFLYNPLEMSDVNPFGVTQDLMTQFNPQGSLSSVEDNAKAFNEAVIAFNGSAEEFLEWWFLQIGRAQDAAEAALLRAKTVNQAEYLENGDDAFGGIDYKKRANTFAMHKAMKDSLTAYAVTSYEADAISSLRDWAKNESGHLMSDEVFDYIVEIAKQRNYSPKLLKAALAVAIQESNGVREATSPVGAHGVFQLMPDTAAELGVDPYDWRQNIQGGMLYLEQKLREFEGNSSLAFAAYNAGSGNVHRYRGVPPFAETQNYVSQIKERLKNISKYEEKPRLTDEEDTGEGVYWVRQHSDVSLKGAQPETIAAMREAGKWFYERTGHPLVISSVTDGNHALGKFSHKTGFKFDAHDYGSGAEGSLTTDDYRRGYLMDKFVKYLQWLGLGANIEDEGTRNIHLDIDVTGRQWAGELAGTNFGGFNKAKASLSRTIKTVNLPYVLEEGGLNSYWNAQNQPHEAPYLSFDRVARLQKDWAIKQRDYEKQLSAMQTRQKNVDNNLELYKSVYEKITGMPYDTTQDDVNRLMRLENAYLLEQNFVEQIKEKQTLISQWRENVNSYVDNFLQSHTQIAKLLSDKGLSWDELPNGEQLSLVKRFGGEGDEELEEMIKSSEQLRQEWDSVNKLLDEHKQKLIDIRYQMASIGNMPTIKPEELENYALKNFELDYKNDTVGTVYENPDRLRQYKLEQLEVLKERQKRLEDEKKIVDENAAAQIQALQERLKKEEDVKKALEQRQKAGEDVGTELETQDALIKRLSADYQSLSANGSQTQMNYQLQIKETSNAIKELEKSLYPIENQLWRSLGDGVINMFDSILLKGSSFKDAWNNLWQSIASMALKQLLMVQLQALSMKFGWGLFGGGGDIPEKKNGGYIPSFAKGGFPRYASGSKIDAGLIRGAGSDTSDSILTYLENRGQFIRTSDGEFIIKKKSVDKLGLSFLNRLNENPEQIALKEKVLNAYADGGQLGEEMTPVMSNKTVENLQHFTKNQSEKESRNVRQEKLLEGISMQLSAFTKPVNETTNMNINAVDSKSFCQLLEKHSDVIMGLMRRERGRRNSY